MLAPAGDHTMITKCANPDCFAPFHYMREGRLFQVDRDAAGHLVAGPFLMSGSGLPHRLEHFWLCGNCAQRLTLALDATGSMVTVPLPPGMRRQTHQVA
jgi:hypothetical protein